MMMMMMMAMSGKMPARRRGDEDEQDGVEWRLETKAEKGDCVHQMRRRMKHS